MKNIQIEKLSKAYEYTFEEKEMQIIKHENIFITSNQNDSNLNHSKILIFLYLIIYIEHLVFNCTFKGMFYGIQC